MRIAWFTPFSIKSAIGKYSRVITNELVKRCEVDLWLSDDKEMQPTNLKVFRYSQDADISVELKNYDFVIYNMGDHLDYHRSIYEASQVMKGVVILHDFVMHHFFVEYYLTFKGISSVYLEDMERYYGINGRDIATESLNRSRDQVWKTTDIVKYPYFEKAIEGATGVIVHSHFMASEVNKGFLGPVETIYHPYEETDVVKHSRMSKVDLGIPEDKLLILTVGHVNPNKRIDKVIDVIVENSDLMTNSIYIVIGSLENTQYVSYLQSMVADRNLQDVVKLMDFQSDDILNSYLYNADIIVNLRLPAMEGASWSLVEELHYGKPIIVSDNGFYSEIPDECVVKIKVDNEINDLRKALTKLAMDDMARVRIGEKGKQFAHANFTAVKYCDNFMNFLEKVQSFRPILQLADRVGQELADMGSTGDMTVVIKSAQEMHTIFRDWGHPIPQGEDLIL